MLALLFASPVVASYLFLCFNIAYLVAKRIDESIAAYEVSNGAKDISEAVSEEKGAFRSRRDISHCVVRRFSKLPRGNFLALNVVFLSS